MILKRSTPANKIVIKAPIWGGRKVGIATYRVGTHNEIEIVTTNKEGERIYPMPFYISGEELRQYPTQKLKNYQVTLYIVPIDDLEMLERE